MVARIMSTFTRIPGSLVLIFACCCLGADAPQPAADETAAVQKLLDAAGEKGGGEVKLEPRQYHIRGTLKVPTGVTLAGAWQAPHHGILTRGTVLMAYGGRGREDGPALVELTASSAVRGITICYPEQRLSELQPYPWAIHGQGMHCTVENVTLVNAWQGIAMGPESNELHVIRNVFGCVLRRGVFIDSVTDIGRIENVHFNPHYWSRSGHGGAARAGRGASDLTVAAAMQQNLEAFIFAKTDWQSVRDTFVFGARIGYHFIATKNGACNGQFSGIAADACQYCVVVDAAQGPGILISNGQFVCLPLQDKAQPRIGVVAGKDFTATLQLTNCSFWGNFTSFAKVEGNGMFSMNQARVEGNQAAGIELLGGRCVVRDVHFKGPGKPHIIVGKDVKRVIVADNFAEGGVNIRNDAGAKLVVRDNE